MATGRIGVTPVLRVRWSDQPTAGTTSLSGLDDNSVALVYDAGYEAVYRNGVLLSRGNDYTATDGTTITLIDATLTGDIIEVFANDLVPLTDAISKGQFTAKGALLSASAASTPGVLAVGANGTVLTADSAETTGLKWATVSASSGPAFSARNATTQSISSGTWTKATWDTENFDTDNCFASDRFTPNKAGYYQINASIANNNNGTATITWNAFYFNGSVNTFFLNLGAEDSSCAAGGFVKYFNGTTDYIEVYVLLNGTSPSISGSSTQNVFSGVWIRS